MFEIKHLKTLATLQSTGNIRKTAEALFLSQSALSHQIKELEHRLSTALFIRNSSPIQFTEQGQVLLNLAHLILPEINKVSAVLAINEHSPKKLRIAIACHACFQWLLPLTEKLKETSPLLMIEFIDQVFSEDPSQQADILFTDDKVENDGYSYHEIGNFELVAVFPKKHKYALRTFLHPEDFSDETLLTYPIKPQQLDIFKLFLDIKNTKPKSIKQVNNSHVMLQMVAAKMGVAAMPKWLVASLTKQSLVTSLPLGETGIFKTLYARYHQENRLCGVIEQLLPEAITAFSNL